jgi:formamidopyrimidine-DNA glycosylase
MTYYKTRWFPEGLHFCRFLFWLQRKFLIAKALSAVGQGGEAGDLTTAGLVAAFRRTRRCVKAVLLDQRVLAGVGNIYADEALFEASLSPHRLGQDLSEKETERLRQAIIYVLDRAIRQHGSTILSFVYGEGKKGQYQNEFRVYGRQGRPCPRCQELIVACRLAGRTTHFCPKCQH